MTPGKINPALSDDHNESSSVTHITIKSDNTNVDNKILNNKKLNLNNNDGNEADSNKNYTQSHKEEKKTEVGLTQYLDN